MGTRKGKLGGSWWEKRKEGREGLSKEGRERGGGGKEEREGGKRREGGQEEERKRGRKNHGK